MQTKVTGLVVGREDSEEIITADLIFVRPTCQG
jgi:hypothetical protein